MTEEWWNRPVSLTEDNIAPQNDDPVDHVDTYVYQCIYKISEWKISGHTKQIICTTIYYYYVKLYVCTMTISELTVT